jgi:hypothetical protein
LKHPILSKSKYINGLQCPRLLWVATNEPYRIQISDETIAIFDQGQEIGHLAQQLYPEGIVIGGNFGENLRHTRQTLALRRVLFEPGFSAPGLYCRLDILVPASASEWDVIEVKSTTRVKKEHLDDLAFQRHVCMLNGLDIRRFFLAHLNPEYVRHGEICSTWLFSIEDITEEITPAADFIEQRIEDMWQTMSANCCPDGEIGTRCNEPYECPLTKECWSRLPPHHVMTLYRGKQLGESLLKKGITRIDDIDGTILNTKQAIQHACVINQEIFVDKKALKGFLDRLEYPLYFMDFETINPALPLFEETSPYQQVPFQFSVHIVPECGADPIHFSFLADGAGDPRPAFMAELIDSIGPNGSIIAYNAAFEQNILKDCSRSMPWFSEWIENACSRLVDLMEPFKDFLYYHPDQDGSASLKHVMPALTGISYEELEINNGAMASREFLRITYRDAEGIDSAGVRSRLLRYCGQDTGGMVEMVKQIRRLIS